MRVPALISVTLTVLLLAACGSPAPRPVASAGTITLLPASEKGNEVALYALGLIDTGYRFGGRNPEAGLDCSGMVSYIYGQATGLKVRGSAADSYIRAALFVPPVEHFPRRKISCWCMLQVVSCVSVTTQVAGLAALLHDHAITGVGRRRSPDLKSCE